MLLHDGRRDKALLTQLGIKQNLKYLNTAHAMDPRNRMTQGMVLLKVSGPDDVTYEAPLDVEQPPPRIPTPKSQGFGQWWRYPVVKDGHDEIFTREQIILTVSNKDGGAHIDEDLPSNWFALTLDLPGSLQTR